MNTDLIAREAALDSRYAVTPANSYPFPVALNQVKRPLANMLMHSRCVVCHLLPGNPSCDNCRNQPA